MLWAGECFGTKQWTLEMTQSLLFSYLVIDIKNRVVVTEIGDRRVSIF